MFHRGDCPKDCPKNIRTFRLGEVPNAELAEYQCNQHCYKVQLDGITLPFTYPEMPRQRFHLRIDHSRERDKFHLTHDLNKTTQP